MREGPFVQVTAGNSATCGIRDDGHIECWGRPQHLENTRNRPHEWDQVREGAARRACGLGAGSAGERRGPQLGYGSVSS